MKKEHIYAIRVTVGILSILGAIALFYLSSGVLVIEALFENEASEYIKYEIISGLWLLYGLTNIVICKKRISAIIANILSAVSVIICLTNIYEYKTVFIISIVMLLLAILSFFLKRKVPSMESKC